MFPYGFLKWKQKKTPRIERENELQWRFLEHDLKTKHYAVDTKTDDFLENSLAYYFFLDKNKCPKIFYHGVFCFHFSKARTLYFVYFTRFFTIFDGFFYFYKKIVGSKTLKFSLVNSKIMHRKQNQRFLRRLSFMH